MTINTTNENGRIVLKLEGWLDTVSSPALGEAVDAIEAADAIVLDFENVEYMASAGLRQVIAAYKKAKTIDAAFSVVNVGTEVMSIFQLTGLDKKIDITGKTETADSENQ